MKVILPSEDEIRRLYMSGYTVKQIITKIYSWAAKILKEHVADYVECTIAEYHYWEDGEE